MYMWASYKKKMWNVFCILKKMKKGVGSGVGSGSGSISQSFGSGDPDPGPHQNVTDPQHYSIVKISIFTSTVSPLDHSHTLFTSSLADWWTGCLSQPEKTCTNVVVYFLLSSLPLKTQITSLFFRVSLKANTYTNMIYPFLFYFLIVHPQSKLLVLLQKHQDTSGLV